MRAVAPLTSVLEQIYAPVPSTEDWLAGIQRALSTAFAGHLGAQASTMLISDHCVEVERVIADGGIAPILMETTRHSDERVVALMRSSGPVIRAGHMIGPGAHPVRDFALTAGIQDFILAFGYADPSRACVASLQIPLDLPSIPRASRAAFARLAAHLAAAYRLRLSLGFADDGDAVLAPNGSLLHANGEEPQHSRGRLRDAALRIARARRESERDPVGGLAFWTAMVEGRWTLVERTESDGKRLLIARRNAPGTREHRALSERERSVLERASYGGSLRHVAYELGIAESTVSETLARAMKKLGLRSRAELVELRAAIA